MPHLNGRSINLTPIGIRHTIRLSLTKHVNKKLKKCFTKANPSVGPKSYWCEFYKDSYKKRRAFLLLFFFVGGCGFGKDSYKRRAFLILSFFLWKVPHH